MRKPISEETREKMRQNRLGKKWSDEIKLKFRLAKLGKPSPHKNKINRYSPETLEKMRISHLGHIPWNKGKKLSEKTIEKLRISHLGKKQSIETINKRRSKISGENCWTWKGGINPLNDTIRKSFEYKQWRRTIFIRDEFTCQKCGLKHTYIIAHHIKPFSKFPELRFDINNGITFCKKCHENIGHYNCRDYKKKVLDSDVN